MTRGPLAAPLAVALAAAMLLAQVPPGFLASLTAAASSSVPVQDVGSPISFAPDGGALPQQVPTADVALSMVDFPDPVVAGNPLTYTLSVTTTGDATSVTLTQSLPGGSTFVSASASQGSCALSGFNVVCSLGSLASGATTAATVVVVPTTSAVPSIISTATVGVAEFDPNLANNDAIATTTVLLSGAADLALTKVDSPDPVLVGSQLTYTLSVTTSGDAQGVVLTDTLSSGVSFVSAGSSPQGNCAQSGGIVTCNLGNVLNGTTVTLTIVVTTIAVGPGVCNSASVTATTPDPNTANNSATVCTNVLGLGTSDLSLTKIDSPDPVNVGGTLTYTISMTTTGDATGVQLGDTLPASATFISASASQGSCSPPSGNVLSCNLGDLGSGVSATVTIVVTPITAGVICNNASVTAATSDPNLENNGAEACTTVQQLQPPPQADLVVTKTDSPDPVTVGGTLTYTLPVTTSGDATNVVVTDGLVAGLNFISASASPQGTCTFAGGVVTCSLGSLASGATATVTIQVGVSPTLAGLTICNFASASAAETDPNPANNLSVQQCTTVVAAGADVAVSKSAPATAAVGATLTYTISVTTSGDATGVQLLDTPPPGTSFVSVAPTGTCGLGTGPGTPPVVCDIGNLASGATFTATLQVTVTAGGLICNTAGVLSTSNDPNPGNNSSMVCTTVPGGQVADLSIVKTASPGSPSVGGSLTYTLSVTTSGDASNVQIGDILPPAVDFVSATPTQGTCLLGGGNVICDLGNLANGATATIQIVVTPIAAGQICNSAGVGTAPGGSLSDPNFANNTSGVCTTVQGTGSADLSVAKAGPPSATIGVPFSYSIAVHSAGDAAGVVVIDPVPFNLAFVSATTTKGTCGLATGAVRCSLGDLSPAGVADATVTITVAPATPGNVCNTAIVAAATNDPDTSSNSFTACVNVSGVAGEADLAVSKLGPPSGTVGGTLTYTISVTTSAQATGVLVGDGFPFGLSFVSATPSQGTCSPQPFGFFVACVLGNLAANATATVTVVLTANLAGQLCNTAAVTAATADNNGLNNNSTACVAVTAAPGADLSVTKVDSPDPAVVGSPLTYTISVHTSGDATNVVLTDALPANATFDSATPSQGICNLAGITLTCALGTLSSFTTTDATVTLVVTPTIAGIVVNTATVSADQADPNDTNNSATASTTVGGVQQPAEADLSLAKSDAPDPVTVGSSLTYTLTVTTSGDATGVTVTDLLDPSLTINSFSASAGSCNQAGQLVTCLIGTLQSGTGATVTIVVTPTTIGEICNSPTTFSNELDPFGANNTAQECTLVANETTIQNVGANGTATTDAEGDGATAADPLETAVTSPNAGTVTIGETAPSGSPPTGFTFLGQQVVITAPTATAANPLRIVFRIDASIIPAGENKNTIQILKDGVAVPACSGPAGQAVLDPCVESRAVVAGDVVITILSSSGSVWSVVAPSAPNISITSPEATTYTLDQVVVADYACTGVAAAIVLCAGPVADGAAIDTASVGTKTFTVNAADAAGNTESASVTYLVTYKICVLYDQTKAAQPNSTVPIKLQICNASNVNVSAASVTVTATSLDGGPPPSDAGKANPDDRFRFDPTLGGTGGYIYNLSTKGLASGTHTVTFTVQGDPVAHAVQFVVK